MRSIVHHPFWLTNARPLGLRPNNLPAEPESVYKNDGWQGFLHFLGSSTGVCSAASMLVELRWGAIAASLPVPTCGMARDYSVV